MTCVVCQKRIRKRDNRVWVTTARGVKKYGCNDCNLSKAFDRWVDEKEKANALR